RGNRRRPVRDRRQLARVLDVGFVADAQPIAVGKVSHDRRLSLDDHDDVFGLHERTVALDVEVGQVTHRLGLEEHEGVEPGILERPLRFLLLDPMQFGAGIKHRVLSLRARPEASRRARAWSRRCTGYGSRSATMAGAATSPAWRMPPPSTRAARRALRMNRASPARMAPSGPPRPLQREKNTESAC